jgi:hypothetical protein
MSPFRGELMKHYPHLRMPNGDVPASWAGSRTIDATGPHERSDTP